MNRFLQFAIALVVIFNLTLGKTLGENKVESIGSRLELFVDDSLVESMDGVDFRLHPPVKALRPKSPLPVHHYITVIKTPEKFQAYWRGFDDAFKGDEVSGGGGETVCYAESIDGHEWEFPELDLHEVDGSKKNNVILARMPQFLHNFVPFLDRRPGVPAAKKYKALAGHPGPGDKRKMDVGGRGLYAFFSPDGIHWTKGDEVIPYRQEWRHAFDSANGAFWSEAEQQYVCYFRTWTIPGNLRSVSRTTSKDFEKWTDPVAMDPNLPEEHLYTTQTHPYFRAPHLYIALPTRYVPGRGSDGNGNASERNATDILLMSTRAGSESFDRLFKDALIRPGFSKARWENRANYVALGVQPTGENEMSIYHRSGDRYTLRTDGFVSVHAGVDPGELITKPIQFAGKSLCLNLSTSALGSALVEIQGVDGDAISGFSQDDCIPLFGDGKALEVQWKNGANLEKIAGRTVRLRIVLKEADLYSYRFGDKPLP